MASQDKRITELDAVSGLTGEELAEVVQSGTNRKATYDQIKDFIGVGIGEAPEDGLPYSRQDAGWVEADGGGHIIQNDGVSLPQQEILNIIGALIEDNAVDGKTKLTLLYSLLNDVDTTGIINGDLMQYNSTSEKYEPVSVAPFDDLLSVSEAVTAVGLSSLFLKANYSIAGIRIESSTGTGSLNIGTTNGGSEIASVSDITGLNDVIEIDSRYFSDVNDTDIYLTGFTGNFTFYLLTIKGGFSDLVQSGGVVSDDVIRFKQTGITANTDMADDIPQGYAIQSIIVSNTSVNNITEIGFQWGSPSFQGITENIDFATGITERMLFNSDSAKFNWYGLTANSGWQIFASVWNSGVVDVYTTCIRVAD